MTIWKVYLQSLLREKNLRNCLHIIISVLRKYFPSSVSFSIRDGLICFSIYIEKLEVLEL